MRAVLIVDVFIVLLLSVVALQFAPPLFQSLDFGWHLLAGQQIMELGEVPQYDAWSFSSDQRWYNISWLWDVVIKLIEDAFGLTSLFTLCCLLLILTLFYLYKSLINIHGVSVGASVVVVLLGTIIIKHNSLMRPQLLAHILMIFLGNALHKNRQQVIELKSLLVVPIIIAIWANFHGSFLIGLAMIFVYFICAIMEKNYTMVKVFFVLGAVSFLCTFINPIGYEVYVGILRTTHSKFLGIISEWHPVSFKVFKFFLFYVLVFIICSNLQDKKILLPSKILALGGLIMALLAVRSIPLMVILGASYLAMRLDSIPHFKVIEQRLKTFHHETIGVALIALVFLSYIYLKSCNETRMLYSGSAAPIQEIEYVKDRYPGKRFFNDYDIGGFIIYFGEGKIRHFIDGRAGTAFSDKLFAEFQLYRKDEEGWQAVIEKYDTFGAIISNKRLEKLARVRRFFANWKIVYRGDKATVFVR